MDLRHALLFAINILKSQVGSAWDWEPFDTIRHPTWIKSFTLAVLLLIFPFTCIQVPLRLNTGHIIVRFGKFDPSYCFITDLHRVPSSSFLVCLPNHYNHLILLFMAFKCAWELPVLAAKRAY